MQTMISFVWATRINLFQTAEGERRVLNELHAQAEGGPL